jgi:competence ComEA-like helix-hairpin-helix protein
LLAEPFTVHTAGADAGGSGDFERVYAFVVTSEGRDLAAQLVEEGLARAYGVLRMGPDGAHREEVRARMADLELTAAKMGRGIWALTDWEKLPEERRIDREEEAELAKAMDPSRQDLDSLQIDPNTASRDELMRLPGIGEVMAGLIVEGREGGRYETPEDLIRVNGIGEKTLAGIRLYLSIAPESPD